MDRTERDYSIPLPDDQYDFTGLDEYFKSEFYRDAKSRKTPRPVDEKMKFVAYHGKMWRENRNPESIGLVIEYFLKKPGVLYEDLVRILGEPQDDCRSHGPGNSHGYPPGMGHTNYSVGDDLWVIGWRKEADGTWRFNGELSHP